MASPLRLIADQAFSRAAGAPLVEGNAVELLCDAQENYPAWLDAIHSAERWVHFESYILRDDQSGPRVRRSDGGGAHARRPRARASTTGWARSAPRRGCSGSGSGGRRRGACFNQPRLDAPLGWLARDHRKMLGVDGRVGFVTGLCVADMWWGRERNKGLDPWRDTGVAVRGPRGGRHRAGVCRRLGGDRRAASRPRRFRRTARIAPVGGVALRVIGTKPSTAGLFRLDQLVAAVARERLWITDAYFVGASPYVQALDRRGRRRRRRAPARAWQRHRHPVMQKLTRAGYRPLLEAGVRIFEWNGTMVHAKTAVADGRWARVGSTNLNLQSWLGNWELDVAVEDQAFAKQMEDVYLRDLQNTTEVVLSERRVRAASAPAHRDRGWPPATPSRHRPHASSGDRWRAPDGPDIRRRADRPARVGRSRSGHANLGRRFSSAPWASSD